MDLQNASRSTREKWENAEKNLAMSKRQLDDDRKLHSFNKIYSEVDALKFIEEYYTPYHRKWGFVVYRTTYSDDEKWARFIDMFQEGVCRRHKH
jgi:hypothetical protein